MDRSRAELTAIKLLNKYKFAMYDYNSRLIIANDVDFNTRSFVRSIGIDTSTVEIDGKKFTIYPIFREYTFLGSIIVESNEEDAYVQAIADFLGEY